VCISQRGALASCRMMSAALHHGTVGASETGARLHQGQVGCEPC
jgi:hypothetical protein